MVLRPNLLPRRWMWRRDRLDILRKVLALENSTFFFLCISQGYISRRSVLLVDSSCFFRWRSVLVDWSVTAVRSWRTCLSASVHVQDENRATDSCCQRLFSDVGNHIDTPVGGFPCDSNLLDCDIRSGYLNTREKISQSHTNYPGFSLSICCHLSLGWMGSLYVLLPPSPQIGSLSQIDLNLEPRGWLI